MKKTKVVEFIGRIQDGGAETLVKDYALLLDKERFDVTVLCEDYCPHSAVYKALKENGVKIVCMYEKSFFLNKVAARLLGKRYVAYLTKKALKELKPDLIHAHLELLEVLYYCRDDLKGINLLWTCHNPPQKLIGDERPAERDACRYLLDHNGLQIIALHEDMAAEIEEMYGIDNVAVIRNAVDFERFEHLKKNRKEMRKELGIPQDAYVVGQVGRFDEQKNPKFTLTLFDELRKRHGNCYLLMIGRGNLEAELRNQIKELGLEDEVKMLVNRDDVPELMNAMDVFILPSRFEGFGIVLIEAQIVGLPCVVSDNVPKAVYQSKNITCLSLNDPVEQWANALWEPTGNIDKYGDIREYDMRREIKNLEELYLRSLR